MLKQLSAQLTERGCQGRVVPIERLGDLYEAIDGQYRQGLLDLSLIHI